MDKTKKKSVKRGILWGVLALIVVWLAVMPLMARQQQENDGPQASILSTNAVMGSIHTTIHGGGTLEAGDPEDITLPKDVKITEFLVKNGDYVHEGDALAVADKVSVMTAITEIQKSMSTVRKQMESASDEKAAVEVPAAAGGRVKLVYAKEGDRVENVMLEHGALAVLSLDSKLCVRFTVDSPLAAGASVAVSLADGRTVTGRVESNLSGELVVTIEDKGYEVGQTVSVENLGRGILEIHSPWKATAFTGTVSIVYALPEQTLGSGAALFTLKDTDYTAQREILAQTHREYEELLQKLFKMYETGVIAAPCDGMVSGIEKDSAHLLAAGEEAVTAQPLGAQEGEYRLVLLSEVMPLTEGGTACSGQADCPAATHDPTCKALCKSADTPEGCTAVNHKEDCINACTHKTEEGLCKAKKHAADCIESCDPAKGDACPATGKHKNACIKSCTHASVTGECTAGKHYSDCIECCLGQPNTDQVCPATKHKDSCYFRGASYSAQVFKVSAVGIDGLVGFIDPTPYQVEKTSSGWARLDGNDFDTKLLTQSATRRVTNPQQFMEGDILLIITVTKDGESKTLSPTLLQRNASMPSVNFSMPSFSFSMPGMGGYGSSSQTQLYDLNGDVLMTVTSQETMKLTVAVDESDISGVKPGMSVEVTVNALPEGIFEGEITKVAKSGSGSGGSSKFAVEITLPREGEMLAGMSASAVISLYEKMNVLTLPAAALTEDGARTIVYTALDKKTGELASPVEVTTGLSDGETVEILSGLKSGDTVYYAYYDTLEESDAVETDRLRMR